jgi:hypothetical protein
MKKLLLISILVCLIFVPGKAAVNEWVLGEPTYAQDNYEWVLGGPFVEVHNVAAAPAAGQVIIIQMMD